MLKLIVDIFVFLLLLFFKVGEEFEFMLGVMVEDVVRFYKLKVFDEDIINVVCFVMNF